MSSTKSVSPLSIKLRPSRSLLLLLLCLYAGAGMSVLVLDIHPGVKITCVIIVLLSYLVNLNRIGWFDGMNQRLPQLFRPAVVALRWREGREWELEYDRSQHAVVCAQLLPSTTVHPMLTVLNFQCAEQPWYRRRCAVVLLPDSLTAEDFRRLRVHLLQLPGPADNAVE
jgi:hypothetical protein